MARITLPNVRDGGKITVQANSVEEAQRFVAQQTNVPLAQQQAAGTFGQESYTGGPGGSGSSGGGSGGPAQQPGVPQQAGVNMDALRSFFGDTAGLSIKQLEEEKRQFDQTMVWYREQLEKLGLPELAIKQQMAALEQQKFQEQTQQVRANTALQFLQTRAQLNGPENYWNAVDFDRGAQSLGTLPVFLQALNQGLQLPAVTGTGSTPPNPQTMASLTGALTGQTAGGAGTPGTPANQQRDDQILSTIGGIFGRGGSALGPQALEQLSDTEKKLFLSGGAKLGFDLPSWLESYNKSRIGQGAAQALF